MARLSSNRFLDFFGKILLFLLVGSFALWGIGDIFRGGQGGNYVAKVGGAAITASEYQQELSFRMASFQQLLGEEFSPEFARNLGIPQQVLREMIHRKLVEMEAGNLNIHIPQSEVLRIIRNNAAFNTGNGFDKDAFLSALRSARISEERYIEALKQENAAQLLLGGFATESFVSAETAEALHKVRNEAREATLYILSANSVGTVDQPDDATLKTYYENNTAQYQTPEYRQIAYFHFRREDLKKDLKADAETLHALYEEHKMAYMEPEKRQVSQLLYARKEDAVHAFELLQSGESLADVAKKIPAVNQETDLGLITRAGLLPEAQETVFALAEKEYSNPIESSFGWHIFQIHGIVAERIPDFEELKPQIVGEWQEAALEEKIYDLSIELEDMVASGVALKEIAAELGRQPVEIKPFDNSGTTPEGKAASLPAVDDLISRVFSENFESAFVTGNEGDYYFFTLKNIIPGAVPAFDTVRPQVLADWKASEQSSQLREKADTLASELKRGNVSALEEYALSTRSSGRLIRTDEAKPSAQGKTAPYKYELFTLAKGEFTGAYRLDEDSYVIARLDNVYPAKTPEKSKLAAISNSLKEQYAQEIEQQYLAWLQGKYSVEVNQPVLNSFLQ